MPFLFSLLFSYARPDIIVSLSSPAITFPFSLLVSIGRSKQQAIRIALYCLCHPSPAYTAAIENYNCMSPPAAYIPDGSSLPSWCLRLPPSAGNQDLLLLSPAAAAHRYASLSPNPTSYRARRSHSKPASPSPADPGRPCSSVLPIEHPSYCRSPVAEHNYESAPLFLRHTILQLRRSCGPSMFRAVRARTTASY